jgi:penicillin-binding protein 1C
LIAQPRTPSTPVLDAKAAWIVSDMLSDPLARSTTFGLENPLASRYWTAVKTGTSKDMRDNWCVGYSEKFTVGVWVGNFDGSPMHDVSGVTGAAPVWMELMEYLHRSAGSAQPKRPTEIVARRIVYDQEVEAAREEYFLAGTELDVIAAKPAQTVRAGIAYPGDGSIIALDPDIPDGVQRVHFQAAPQLPGQRWRLDGVTIGDPDRAVRWAPTPGRHALALLDARGEELDRVHFEVRGALR